MKEEQKHAVLLVIDVQKDFCPGGALAVNGGDRIIPLINKIMEKFERVVATQDWHPVEHTSFAVNHKGKKVLDTVEVHGITQVLWPEHCVQGTEGADFHPDLEKRYFNLILRKGMNPELDSYSAFFENDKTTSTGLEYYLKGLGLSHVYICGLATDYCVYYSAMDALKLGFQTLLIEDATQGVDLPSGSVANAIAQMKNAGIKVIGSSELW
jgi:nicotinamidase/pyrazinamidase